MRRCETFTQSRICVLVFSVETSLASTLTLSSSYHTKPAPRENMCAFLPREATSEKCIISQKLNYHLINRQSAEFARRMHRRKVNRQNTDPDRWVFTPEFQLFSALKTNNMIYIHKPNPTSINFLAMGLKCLYVGTSGTTEEIIWELQ